MKTIVCLSLCLAGLLVAVPAHAQAPAAGSGTPTEIVSVDKPTPIDPKVAIQGWNPYLALTASMNLVDNSNVIGQTNGTAVNVAAGASGGGDYTHGRHFLSLNGLINEGYARTPVVNHFVKTNDIAKVDGIYNYFVTPNFGGYGRLSMLTSLFESQAVVGTPTTFIDVTHMTPVTVATNTESFHLSNGFQPFTLTESVGAFVDPINKPEFALSFRVGIGGRSTFANGAYAIHPNAMDTTAIELLELSDVEQLGIEGFGGITGKLDARGAFTYRIGAAVLLPFVNDDSFHRSAVFLTRVVATANLTYTFSKWLSAVYNLSVIRDPQLFPSGEDQVQVQNTFLLTFQLGLVAKKEGPKPKTADQLAVEAAKAAAAKAAAEALDAENKLHELQIQMQQQQQPPPAVPNGTTTPPAPPSP
jgi:hypothetical protein